MDIASIVVQLIGGAVGGNAAGAASKPTSLGVAGNSVLGGIGGVVLGQVLPMILGSGVMPAGVDVTAIAAGFAAGGVGGAITALVIGFVKTKMAKA